MQKQAHNANRANVIQHNIFKNKRFCTWHKNDNKRYKAQNKDS